MSHRITVVRPSLVGGLLTDPIELLPGLNIISGENGTLKSRFLAAIKDGSAPFERTGEPIRMLAVSPKRNSERRAAQAIVQNALTSSRTWEREIQERIGRSFNNTGFENYSAIGDIFYLHYHERCKDGGDQQTHMNSVLNEFNGFISSVFPTYRLAANWDTGIGAPSISIIKHASTHVPIHELSMGEQEVLSLIALIATSIDNIDVFLIDEPEVHLNWTLENGLFEFIDKICVEKSKQAIIVTHSRAIFKPELLSKSQFFYWNESGGISATRTLNASQREQLAGEALQVVALGDFGTPVVHVEDASHVRTLEWLASELNSPLRAVPCGNSQNVKSLFVHQRSLGRWTNAYFLIDGDNQGNPFPGDEQFIQMPVYCMENIFLDPDVIASVTGKSVEDIQNIILNILKENRSKILGNNKYARFVEFLVDELDPSKITYSALSVLDGSTIIRQLSRDVGFLSESAFASKYLSQVIADSNLKRYIPEALINILRTESAYPPTDG